MQTLEQAHSGPDASYYGDKPDWLIALAVTRDGDILDRANYAELEARLEDADEWTVERSGHWAVGWVDYIVVKPGTDAARIADEANAAMKDYPVLDDERYSNMETDEAIEACADAFRQWTWGKHGDVDADPDQVAPYVYQVSEDMNRGVGYYGSDFWPDAPALTFGYLAYLRAQRT